MDHGYSQNLVQANRQASARSLGVALGRLCIRNKISVREVSETFGVSRMTVYNWFRGVHTPHGAYTDAIQRYIQSLK